MTRRLVVFGLSLSSAWGNGHATPFRGLCRELAGLGWQITFFERDVEWYRNNRDLTQPAYCDLRFYDIDTPITLTGLQQHGEMFYLRADQVSLFDTYFSFTGGPALAELEQRWSARRAEALYCGVDPSVYQPAPVDDRFTCQLGYMGTYAADRQPKLESLLIDLARARPARRFLIAGPLYPPMELPANVQHIEHVYPRDHAAFYSSNVATLNLTRDAMRRYGWSPASRLFEAAACGACIISDTWPGLEQLLEPGREVLLADSAADVAAHLDALTPQRRAAIGRAARERVLSQHTFARRAEQVDAALARTLATVSAP